MLFHENRLPTDDSPEKRLIFIFEKQQNLKCRLLQIIRGALWVNKNITLKNGKTTIVKPGSMPFFSV